MRDRPRSLLFQLMIVAAGAVIFFTNLGGAALWDMDEALYSTCAREMFQRGDWVVPMFNGQMFPEKPPLMFWTMMAGFEVFGINELGARFFSAVLGIGTALMAFHLGRILFSPRVGLWAGLATASTIIFTVSARAATVDMSLTFVTTAAVLLFVLAGGGGLRCGGGSSTATPTSSSTGTPTSNLCPVAQRSLILPYAILMYACIGVAVLAKGPVGMLLPLAAIGFFLLVVNVDRPWIPLALLYAIVLGSMLGECLGLLVGRWVTPMRLVGMLLPLLALAWYLLATIGWRSMFGLVWRMRPLTAIIIIAAVAVPWYVLVGIRTDGRWLREFFLEFNLRPFQQPIQGHGDTSSFGHIQAALVSMLFYFFHVAGVLFGFFPWAALLGPTLVNSVRQIQRRDALRDGCLLAACWFSVWLVFWSLCKTKLPHYILPAYPALALLTGYFIERWLAEPGSIGRWQLRNGWLSIILVGVGVMIALPIVALILLPGEELIGLVGLILVIGGGWCWWETAHDRHRIAAMALALTSVIFLTTAFGFASLRVDRHQNGPAIGATRRRFRLPPIGSSGRARSSMRAIP